MPRRDYYAVLGVKRSTGPEEIKKAFRALAKEYHPDRSPDDVDAERRFREIVEAYECLSDPEERARYDRLGPFYRSDGKPPTPDDINSFVSDTLNSVFRRDRSAKPGDDIEVLLTITLEEVGNGCSKVVNVSRLGRCKRCAGDGADPEQGRRTCDGCDGSGKAATRRLFRTECPRCDGRGFVITKPCTTCNGEGRAQVEETIKVKVPPGVATGQRLKVREKGHAGQGSAKNGDLYVLVQVADHPLFHRRGADLICEVPLRVHEAVLGTNLDVPTVGSMTTIRVPPGTGSGKVFRLTGRGLPRMGKGNRGDLHIKVLVEIPTNLSEQGRSAVKTLENALDTSAYPRRNAFEDNLRKRP